MDPLRLPPEIEAQVRAFAEAEHTDLGAAAVDLIKRGLAAARKQAFDRELLENNAAGDRGEYITAEESLAEIAAIERGE